jgi:hypothetical protein
MNIALIGPSGVGKGTHAQGLCESFNLRHAAIGEVPLEQTMTLGTRVWVTLQPEGRHHVASRVSLDRPDPVPGVFAVRGTVAGRGGGSRRVEYGIESYFVPEGLGTPQFTRLEIEASVTSSGRLQIRRMLLDGVPYLQAGTSNRQKSIFRLADIPPWLDYSLDPLAHSPNPP